MAAKKSTKTAKATKGVKAKAKPESIKQFRYALNKKTGEIHDLRKATGSCHLSGRAEKFYRLGDIPKQYTDRCGHCFGATPTPTPHKTEPKTSTQPEAATSSEVAANAAEPSAQPDQVIDGSVATPDAQPNTDAPNVIGSPIL